ncbi:MAG: AarF/ABC1/UbiB kinase family protein [Alphaproteobacteria bacterium]|nr:AarF/ABC1/UbiB kinase family protein [Alphaproteobacteria bacterium]
MPRMVVAKKHEPNRLTQRAKRYAKVSTSFVKVGAHASVHSSLDPVFLRSILGNLKGPLMKAAQFLATIPDLLPPPLAHELVQLQTQAPPMDWKLVQKRMRAALGPDWLSHFQTFEKTPRFSASLGQVHKAVTKDGQTIACKLQYPEMESLVEADLQQLKLLLSLFQTFDRAAGDLSGPWQEIAARFREELDYMREAKNINLYAKMLEDMPDVHTPTPLPTLSTAQLLSMRWLEGVNIMEHKKDFLQSKRNAIATSLFRIWYKPLFHYGILHADPHPGNYTVREEGAINLFDFGCVRIFEAKLINTMITLYHALLREDESQAYEAFTAWGFENLSKEHFKILLQWARFIHAPFLKDKTGKLHETSTAEKGKALALQIHRDLRQHGGLKIPPSFVFIDRASLSLGAAFLHLDAQANWHQLFQELIEGFTQKSVAARQKKLLTA